jgi:spore germination cell wall hydrolase CwlJ-like protein
MNAGPIRFVATSRVRAKWAVPALLALVALVLVTAGLFANVNHANDLRQVQQMARAQAIRQQAAVAPLNLVRPLTPEQAIQANEERPFNAAPDTPARQFKLRADETSRDRALECLTQAVYYEAASEGVDGQRAVAQVVLNRMRHPGFPSTVCGVVYQGSQLPTGCQFTFTCDGSLARTRVQSLWTQARKVAIDALAGHVFAAVGHATHYHADYVLPYWADSLAKQVQIGHHIFYRLKGGLGTDAAFSQRYAGKEPDLPPPPSSVEVAVQATDQAQALLNSGLAGDHPPAVAADAAGLAAAGEPKQVLLADANKGALLVDKSEAPVPGAKRRQAQDCAAGDGKRILPAAPNDLHAGNSDGGC